MRGAVCGVVALAAVVAGCSSHATDRSDSTADSPADASGTAGASTTTGTTGGADLPQGDEEVALDPADFTTTVDNRWFPLRPRTQWLYREAGVEGAFDVLVTVTSETVRLANGVEARVVRDTVKHAGEVVEDTFDWYAQDSNGTVWYLGEDTIELEDGHASHEGSFEAGKDGAQAGVIMPADPQLGDVYRQEYLAGEAEDNGAVLATARMADVPAGHYDDLVLTEDTTPLEPRVSEYKLYAPGVGLVLTLGVSGGASREALLDVRQVSAAEARAAGTTPLGQRYSPS
jgi:hypothetical protein